MLLIFFLLLAIILILIKKLAKWCYGVSYLLNNSTSKETQDYMEMALKEERVRKETVKKEVLSSKYLSSEYLIKGKTVGRDSKVRHTIDELINGMEKERM